MFPSRWTEIDSLVNSTGEAHRAGGATRHINSFHQLHPHLWGMYQWPTAKNPQYASLSTHNFSDAYWDRKVTNFLPCVFQTNVCKDMLCYFYNGHFGELISKTKSSLRLTLPLSLMHTCIRLYSLSISLQMAIHTADGVCEMGCLKMFRDFLRDGQWSTWWMGGSTKTIDVPGGLYDPQERPALTQQSALPHFSTVLDPSKMSPDL